MFGYKEGITKEAQNLGSRAKLLKQAEDGVEFDQRKFGLGQGLRPQLINFVRSERIFIKDVTLLNSPFWVIHPLLCKNITVLCASSYSQKHSSLFTKALQVSHRQAFE